MNFSRRRSPFFALAATVLIFLAIPCALRAQQPVTGRNAATIAYPDGQFRLVGPRTWVEETRDGRQFKYIEESRTDQFVNLADPSRGAKLQLDVNSRKIFYSDAGTPKFLLYPITNAAIATIAPAPAKPPVITKRAPTAAPPTAPVVISDPLPTNGINIQAMVAEHNRYRTKHCASPVTWSAQLAASAQDWANNCRCDHNHPAGGFGENLACGQTSVAEAVGAWYNEIAKYNFATPEANFPQAGHFSQVVWKSTTQIGCGVKAGCPNFAPGQMMWVCRYSQPGNLQGAWGANVSQACR